MACGETLGAADSGISRSDGVALVRCLRCGLLQVEHVPLNVASFYDAGYFQKDATSERSIGYARYNSAPWTESLWQIAFARGVIQATRERPVRVLDVGCATGRFLHYAAVCGWEAVGVDLSEAAVDAARARGHVAFTGELMDARFPDAHFHIITCWDVLEHMVAFSGFLAECKRVLRPDGFLLFSTPDCGASLALQQKGEWIGYRSSLEHTVYFERASLRRLLVGYLGGHVHLSQRTRSPYTFLVGYWSPDRAVDDEALPPPGADSLDRAILQLSFDSTEATVRFDPSVLPMVRAWKALEVGDWAGALTALEGCPPHPYTQLLWEALGVGISASAEAATESEIAMRTRIVLLTQVADAAVRAGVTRTVQADGHDGAGRVAPAGAVDNPDPQEPGARISEGLRAEVTALANGFWGLRQQLDERGRALERAENDIAAQKALTQQWKVRAEALSGELNRIYSSKSWRVLVRFWAWRRRWKRLSTRGQHVWRRDRELPPWVQAVAANKRVRRRMNGSDTYDVLVFGVINWGFRFQRPQQLAQALVRAGHRVFYVAAEFTPSTHPEIRTVASGVQEIVLASERPGLTPYGGAMDAELRDLFRGQILRIRERFHVGSAVSIVDLPFWAPLAIQLKQDVGWRVVYDCMDRHDGFSTNDSAMIGSERTLVQNADLVVASSEAIYRDVATANDDAARVLIRNGVDVDYFSRAFQAEAEHSLPLVVGYYGAIAEWFDVHAVARIAEAHPEWRVELVGDVTHPSARATLSMFSNVHFVGEVPYGTLVDYLRTFSVCVIPFLVTPLTEATNPVKLYEYLASGRPCVSTRLPEVERLVREHPGIIDLVGPDDDWSEVITRATQGDSASRRTLRREVAQQSAWVNRCEALRIAIRQVHPSVSIIVVCFNNAQYTAECLRSIDAWAWSYPGDIDTIVVDNASSDDTPRILREWAASRPKVQIRINPENRGFAAANNEAIRLTRGEVVVFLNNDAYLAPGAIDRLVSHLDPGSGIGLVGPVTNEIGNEARINVSYRQLADMPAFALEYTGRHGGHVFDIGVCALFCAAIRRDLLANIGGLDERFDIGMFEDDDLAMAVRARGLRVVCAEDAFVHHVGRAAFAQMPIEVYTQLMEGNRRRWETKWGVPWTPHRYRSTVGTEDE